MGGVPNRRPVQQQQQQRDMLLANPDFELQGAAARQGGVGRGRMPAPNMGMMPSGGRYPGGEM